MRRKNVSRWIILIISIFCLFTITKYFIQKKEKLHTHSGSGEIFVLWWTEILKNYHETKQCGIYKCTFTVNRSVLKDGATKAIAFYGSDINIFDLPLPRRPHQQWALYHEESPKNIPYIQFGSVLKHFNMTATFSRYSDLPLTTQYIDSIEELLTRKYLVPLGEKNRLRKKSGLAPVAFIQSICDTMSGRDTYVKELMEYIDVDSYGSCLHNKDLPETLSKDYLRTIEFEEFYRFLARYKFIIAFENAVCNDYITEKLWRSLIIGSVPIYFGSPTILDWLPNKPSAILINDFKNAKELSIYLKYLDNNDTEYNKYLNHKYSQINPISNKLLENAILDRNFSKGNIFEGFECFVCKRIHSNLQTIADEKHYDCDDRLHYPNMDGKVKNSDWQSILSTGKCQAYLLDKFLVKNKNFTAKEFEYALNRLIQSEECKVY